MCPLCSSLLTVCCEYSVFVCSSVNINPATGRERVKRLASLFKKAVVLQKQLRKVFS